MCLECDEIEELTRERDAWRTACQHLARRAHDALALRRQLEARISILEWNLAAARAALRWTSR